MTTLTEAPAVVEEAAAVAEQAPAEEAKSRRTRGAAIAAVEAAFAAFADQMILARRLTLGTHNVQDGSLCLSGTKEFMTRGRLQPLKRAVHPREEREEEAAEAEERIRAWVRTQMPGALEDFTATGLMKQVAVIETAHKKWHDGFRTNIIDSFKGGYIHAPRMAEVMPQLGMEPYEARMYANIVVNADWHAPVSAFGGSGLTMQEMNARLKERIVAAIKEIAGEGAATTSCNYGYDASSRGIRVSMDTWRS